VGGRRPYGTARLGGVPVATVELRTGASATPDDPIAHRATRLGRYELPATIVIVDRLPRAASAKVDPTAVRTSVRPAGGPGGALTNGRLER